MVRAACFMAVMAGASASQAQSNVTISGFLDVGVYRDYDKAGKVGPIQPSNITFRGSEDLGSGLATTFALSHRLDTSTGAIESANKPFWSGEATVGLKGSFGSVQIGRRLDAIYSNDYDFDPWYYFNRVASPAWDLWHYNFPSDPKGNSGTAEYGRLNNGVFYDSPKFAGGFSVHLSASPEKSPADNNKPIAATVKYSNKQFAAMYAYGKNSAGNTDNFFALKGHFGNFALMGAYDVSKASLSKAKSLTLGGTYTMGNTVLRAGWGQVDVDGVKAQKAMGIGVLYSLSKRTSVYADLGRKVFPSRSANAFGAGLTYTF